MSFTAYVGRLRARNLTPEPGNHFHIQHLKLQPVGCAADKLCPSSRDDTADGCGPRNPCNADETCHHDICQEWQRFG